MSNTVVHNIILLEFNTAYQDEFVKHGGTIQDNLKVTEIIPGQIVTVNTSSGTYQTKKLIIAAGSWTRAICRNLRMHLPFKVCKYV